MERRRRPTFDEIYTFTADYTPGRVGWIAKHPTIRWEHLYRVAGPFSGGKVRVEVRMGVVRVLRALDGVNFSQVWPKSDIVMPVVALTRASG